MDRLPWGIFEEIVVEKSISQWDGEVVYSASVMTLEGSMGYKVQGMHDEWNAVDQLINYVWSNWK